MNEIKRIRVLIIDDSAMVRQLLAQGLSKDSGIEVVGTAPDPYIARDMIVNLRPHVLTLDVEMPRMDGVEFLRKLMPQYPLPVVMVSSLTQRGKQITLDALEAGAIDFITKPTSNIKDGLNSMITELRTKIKIASMANVSHWKGREIKKTAPKNSAAQLALHETTDKIIAIGASTGGTEALRRIVNALPASMPGIVVVQHMPPGFTQMYAENLNRTALMRVVEGKSGELISPGKIIIAPGAMHMEVKRSGGEYRVECFESEKVNGHCPSVEVLFNSVAKYVGRNAIGVILTGMGGDGGKAMLTMKEAGSYNLSQSEESCVVYGMPKVAFESGGVHEVLHLENIADRLIDLIRELHGKNNSRCG